MRKEILKAFNTEDIKNPVTLKSIQTRLENIDRAIKRAYSRFIAELKEYN